MGRWAFEGVGYATRGEMCAARRRRYAELLEAGMNFTQAARAVGVSKRTGKVWRNGRTRSNGRNEKPSVDRYRSTVDVPQKISSRYLDQDERISIADWRKAGMSVRGIARRLNRPASTVSRELARNANPATGMCLCSISCCGFSHDDFSGLGRACRPRNGLNWMVLVSPPERTGKDYDQHAPSTVYPSFAAERGIRRVDRAENTCQRADGA